MKLSELKKLDKCKIKTISSDKVFKDRLISFGIRRGIEVEIKDVAPGGATISIATGSTVVALRKEEAENIEVEK